MNWNVGFHTEATNMKKLDRIRKQIPAARRRRIAARAATLMAEDKSLQELRQAHKLTQKRMAEVLGVGQDSVSRLEQRSDLLLSTLRGYVEALGGRLSLVAEFPNQDPVVLSGIAALETEASKP
jgi:DNA-binding transcriptional regulator YiaG